MPTELVFKPRGTFAELQTDLAHVRITLIGETYAGLCNGVADFILSTTRLDFFLGNELARIVQTAIIKAPPYKLNVAFVSWLEIWDVDEDAKQGTYKCPLPQESLDKFTEQVLHPIRLIFPTPGTEVQ